MIAQITPTLTACNDDQQVINRMKALGVYEEFERIKHPTNDSAMFTPDGKEAFVWFGVKNDSGYVHIQTSDPAEILKVFVLVTEIMKSGQTPDKSKMH